MKINPLFVLLFVGMLVYAVDPEEKYESQKGLFEETKESRGIGWRFFSNTSRGGLKKRHSEFVLPIVDPDSCSHDCREKKIQYKRRCYRSVCTLFGVLGLCCLRALMNLHCAASE